MCAHLTTIHPHVCALIVDFVLIGIVERGSERAARALLNKSGNFIDTELPTFLKFTNDVCFCVCMCVCMWVCMHVCLCVCFCVCVFVCLFEFGMCVCVFAWRMCDRRMMILVCGGKWWKIRFIVYFCCKELSCCCCCCSCYFHRNGKRTNRSHRLTEILTYRIV